MLDTGVVGSVSDNTVQSTQPHRCSVEELIATVSGAGFDLYPLQGLFACEQQGCLAEFQAQKGVVSQVDQAYFHIACIRNAARRFLACHEQGSLFICMPVRILLNRAFRFRLSQIIQQDARLYGRLVLLMRADDLYSSCACMIALRPACRDLSLAGVRFGIRFGVHLLPAVEPAWINSEDISALSPCVVISYSDALTQDRIVMQALAEIIRSSRSAGWPLLTDYRHSGRLRRIPGAHHCSSHKATVYPHRSMTES